VDPATGLFRLAVPVPNAVDKLKADSISLAVAALFAQDPFGAGQQLAQSDRGSPIDYEHLHVCERPIYVRSALETFPMGAPGYIRRAWGPKWAVTLCGPDGFAQLSVGVPDNPSDLQVVDGVLVRSRTAGGGSDFNVAGIPLKYPFGLPLSPEDAVRALYLATGRRINSVPEPFDQLDEHGFGQLPLCASWRLNLESPITARATEEGDVFVTSVVFVRHAPACYSDDVAFYVAIDAQPLSWTLTFPKDTVTNDLASGSDSISVSPIGPVTFKRVQLPH
jgi:hypothetical protein